MDGPARMLLHPDVWYSGRAILTELETATIADICPKCSILSVEKVKSSGALVKEELVIDEAVNFLLELQSS